MKYKPALAVITALLALAPTTALASPATQTFKDINTALTQQGENTKAAKNASIALPDRGNQGVVIGDQAGTQIRLSLPATTQTNTQNGIKLYNGTGKDNQIALQSTNEGVRALIHIDSREAPERYDFPLEGAISQLKKQDDGSVIAFNAADERVGHIDAPWAQDRVGTPVPTHYEINGTTLIQVVEHRNGNYEYGITADPFWKKLKKALSATWDAAKCAASVTAVAIPAAKAYKAIKHFGGVKKTVKLLHGAGSASDFAEIGGWAAAEILGINGVKEHCF